jgi:hypothetical protein
MPNDSSTIAEPQAIARTAVLDKLAGTVPLTVETPIARLYSRPAMA